MGFPCAIGVWCGTQLAGVPQFRRKKGAARRSAPAPSAEDRIILQDDLKRREAGTGRQESRKFRREKR
ncbi:hypothetical protein T11_7630 [Trichinella zimbabwensis]|uniref:Uncharacterized protein n=1 Tax=Trichinella zimbabwensis TaxID=268475 RepID=A0A0V1GUY2_9BILA|nr:hypothetical protein T11_7630 [Trichinella zimbabwensis]